MTAAAQTATPAQDATFAIDRRARFEILGAVMLALFLAALDQTIVGTALPRILTDLRGTQMYTWVVTVYLLTSTVSGPLYGKLSDQFGRRPMLMIGISIFLFGSLLERLRGVELVAAQDGGVPAVEVKEDAAATRVALEQQLGAVRAELERAEGRLANEGFTGRAPAELVEAEREKARRFAGELSEIERRLAALG